MKKMNKFNDNHSDKDSQKHFDIIGDIHGFAGKLRELLVKLGYAKTNGCFRHPERKAIFLGDFIDRGPANFETLETVRAMVMENTALTVMGNHEYNALCYHTRGKDGEFLRPHIEKNLRQHGAVLKEIDRFGQDKWQEYLEWFRHMPLILELDGLRVVHACWKPKWTGAAREIYDKNGRMTDAFLEQSMQVGTPAFEMVDILLKGEEIYVPQGHPGTFDRDGNLRRKLRLKWWASKKERASWHTYGHAVRADRSAMENLETVPLPDALKKQLVPGDYDDSPVLTFFGHYWFTGRPAPLSPNIACLDYSIGKGGKLACYRWDGETELDPEKFVWV